MKREKGWKMCVKKLNGSVWVIFLPLEAGERTTGKLKRHGVGMKDGGI